MDVIEQVKANGVRYALMSDGKLWAVRYTYADGSYEHQRRRNEADARKTYRAMVRGARLLESRQTKP